MTSPKISPQLTGGQTDYFSFRRGNRLSSSGSLNAQGGRLTPTQQQQQQHQQQHQLPHSSNSAPTLSKTNSGSNKSIASGGPNFSTTPIIPVINHFNEDDEDGYFQLNVQRQKHPQQEPSEQQLPPPPREQPDQSSIDSSSGFGGLARRRKTLTEQLMMNNSSSLLKLPTHNVIDVSVPETPGVIPGSRLNGVFHVEQLQPQQQNQKHHQQQQQQ